jgi:hypothetical protein
MDLCSLDGGTLMSDQEPNSPAPKDANLEQTTGGFAGQAGYNNDFAEGSYRDQDTAEGGQVEDRAGSYEDGYRTPDRDTALDAQPLRDPVGNGEPSNNYTEGRELGRGGDIVVED